MNELPADLESLSRDELIQIVLVQAQRIGEFERLVVQADVAWAVSPASTCSNTLMSRYIRSCQPS